MRSSVIIPNYNGIDYLRDCLNSLNGCEGDFVTIVVDNGSNDGSADMVRESYPDVKLIALSENTGFAPAVNRGIEAADTEYVILLNNDTTVDSKFVMALEAALDSDSKIFSASARMVDMKAPDVLDGTGDYYCALGWAFAYGKGKKAEGAYISKRNIFSACGGAAIYRREALVDMGAFDEEHFAYLEDVDVGWRARIAGFKNVYEPSAIVRHAGSGFSGSRYNEFKVKLSSRNSMYIVLKNMPLLQLIINLPFLIIGFGIKTLFFIKKGMGKTYIKGLSEGIKLYFSDSGHKHKVAFKMGNLMNYVKIQLELWLNILRRLVA